MTYHFGRNNTSGCPCKDCEDRYPGCHDRCEGYKAWKKKLEEKNKAEAEYRERHDTLSEAKKRQLWRNSRYPKYKRYLKND